MQAFPLAAVACLATIGCLLLLVRLVASSGSLGVEGRAALDHLDPCYWPPPHLHHLQAAARGELALPQPGPSSPRYLAAPSSPHLHALSTLRHLATPPRSHQAWRESRLVRTMATEACCKAREAGRNPSYGQLCISLVHHYSLDINDPVLADGMTIFHCACLSGSWELVSALLPLADLEVVTELGESGLHLAVQTAASSGGLEVVEALVEAGCRPELASRAGVTPRQLAASRRRLGLLLDPGTKTVVEKCEEERVRSPTKAKAKAGSRILARLEPYNASPKPKRS